MSSVTFLRYRAHLIPGIFLMMSLFVPGLAHAVDTTPPVVTPPPNIVIEATGPITAVTLGNATAVDDVDGSVTPSASLDDNEFKTEVDEFFTDWEDQLSDI